MTNSAKPGLSRIAVVITCHNRRTETLRCLRNLYDQDLSNANQVSVYLVDDGCSDGTPEAVRSAFPSVNIISGDGSLFWNGGMRLAFGTAMRGEFDFYLWLNDDTYLYRNAIKTLLAVSQDKFPQYGDCIVVGSTQDPDTGAFTYGGVVHASRWHPLKFQKTAPKDHPIRCDSFGGNCVLISAAVARQLGNLDSNFTHLMGDTDYGLRAGSLGIPIWIAPNFQGSCAANPVGSFITDATIPLRKRLSITLSPKGLPPQEWGVIAQRHGGSFWWLFAVLPYFRFAISAVMANMRAMLPRRPLENG